MFCVFGLSRPTETHIRRSVSLHGQLVMPATWKEVVSAKRADRDALIATHRSPTAIEEHATSLTDINDVVVLQGLLKARTVSAEEITLAYVQK